MSSTQGLATSLAWGIDGKVEYVLEGNINYTGAVVTWLKDNLQLITSESETQSLAEEATEDNTLYLVPAFSGLGAPYWKSNASAAIMGMSRRTGKKELVRAALESIAYQITDIIMAMEKDAGLKIRHLLADGGPTGNSYLMKFQSDLLQAPVLVLDHEELSGIGVAYMGGISLGFWDKTILKNNRKKTYFPQMDVTVRDEKLTGWKNAVVAVIRASRNNHT